MSGGHVEAWRRLCDVLREVEGITLVPRPGGQATPPAIYVPPPSLTWDGYRDEPTEAVYEVVLAVKADELAIERLFDLLGVVTQAIDRAGHEGRVDAVVRTAEPGVWRVGNLELPCYFIRTEVAT
jgi:hypothetical protein